MNRPNRLKYGNSPTMYHGRKYDSKLEANHAKDLDSMRKAVKDSDRVVEIFPQYRVPIELNGKHICDYVADFYVKFGNGHSEFHETKGFKTAIYKLKKKLVEAQYGLKIIEIYG